MDTRGKTSKRKRRRMEASTPTRGSSSNSPAGRRTPGSAGSDSTIVWKESPVDKQIRVSGTGKMAVRKEVQGFVGRLARASTQSPPASVTDSAPESGRELLLSARHPGERQSKPTATQEHGKTFRVQARAAMSTTTVTNRRDSTEKISRHLLFSPESATSQTSHATPPRPPHPTGKSTKKRQSHDKSDSQDDVLNMLDKMDERYASQDGTDSLHHSESANEQNSALHTPVRPGDQPRQTNVAAVTPPPTVSVPKISVPNVPVTSNPTTDNGGLSPEFGSPLTEESWELLDQLEFQATQRLAAEVRPSQDNSGSSSQSLALTPRPMPSPAKSKAPSHGQASSPQQASAGSESHALGEKGYARFVVLEADRDFVQRVLVLRLLDERENHLEAILVDDWFDTSVEAGDTINIVFTVRDHKGFFSTGSRTGAKPSPNKSEIVDRSGRILVNNEQNAVILHPDILVSPTSVTTSFGCLRRSILRETLNVTRPTHHKAFLGTLKHELFERSLVRRIFTREKILAEARSIVQSNIIGLFECGLTEEIALQELNKVAHDYQAWFREAIDGVGSLLNLPPPNPGARVQVKHVLATEEKIWSIMWGMKGATDASVTATFTKPGESASSGVVPLELKTGSKVYAGAEHQGQVILYTLLLSERYQQLCQDGLLMYVPGIEVNRIAAMAAHVRGLIIARNSFASAMARVKAVGSSTSTQVLPAMIRMRQDCERCFQLDECVLHHAAVENGSSESSGLDELFTEKTGHLTDIDHDYFRKWTNMIDLEQQHAEKNIRALWLQVGWKREKVNESGSCIADLRLVSDNPALSDTEARRSLRFQRDPRRRTADPVASFEKVRFRVDERVILSAESYDGSAMLVHIAKGKVTSMERDLITIETFQSIPSIVASGKSSVGKDFTWRLDKDSIMSGLARAKENLVRLFIGPPPEVISAGTSVTNRPEIYSAIQAAVVSGEMPNHGDFRRRSLVVRTTRPRFKSNRVTELITQHFNAARNPSLASQGKALLDEFSRLNIDQQRAVQRVLNTLDYALILGMPGTGKTSTIAFTVRILLFLGFSVLVTSYTHSAVDNLLLKLLEYDIPILRVGNSSQVHPRLAAYTLDQQVKQQSITSVKQLESRIMNAKLVGCTCLSINSNVVFMKRRFDFCVVDEATQITQPVVLGALRCADSFVLIGDHYQLPPLVASAQARKEGMDVSLFQRLSDAHPSATQQLSFQYRMNADIMMLANRLVYADKLKCGSFGVASNHLKLKWTSGSLQYPPSKVPWPISVLTNNRGVVFLNTDKIHEAAENSSNSVTGLGGSHGRRRMENVVEAQIVAGLVEMLVYGGVPVDEIAVISPFRSQVSLINRQLKTRAQHRDASLIASVEVSTIDKYQGKDKDVVLVSFVRCNAEMRVGELLTDWRRINVALTRAKQKLLLVGSQSTLSGGSALFHVLWQLVQDQRWSFDLPPDAVHTLYRVASGIGGEVVASVEPEPESEHEGRRVSVSVMGPTRASNDIESLVPDISARATVHRGRSRPRPLKPVTRDVFGGLE